MWSPCPQISSFGWAPTAGLLGSRCQLGIGQGAAGVSSRSGHLRIYLTVRHRRSTSKDTPAPHPHRKKNDHHFHPPPFSPFQDIKHAHAENTASLRCKKSRVSFLTPANPEGSVADPSSSSLKKKKKQNTIAISGLMHICHARRIGGPDGHDTVAGASTNVCGCPCCYLYRGETQTRKYLQKDSGPFLLGVKVITNINRWD